jgi:AAA family ATP:ADP antiporter
MSLFSHMWVFGKLRRYFLLATILALTIYIHNILKGSKDTLIVAQLGAELISTLKLFGVMPAALLFVVFYTKLTNHLSRTQVYHFLNFFFNGFFLLFAFGLYPHAADLHLDLSLLSHNYPLLRYQFMMIENWSYSLFYIMSELWGNVMLSLMFWQVLNQITTVDEAKRLYPALGIFGEVGLVMSGLVAAFFTSSAFTHSWDVSLRYICLSVALAGILISFLFYLLCHFEIGTDKLNERSAVSSQSTTLASLYYVFKSAQMRKLIGILFCYGASINLLEGVWKGYLKLIYPTGLAYAHYMAIVQAITGTLSFASLLLGVWLLPRISWRMAALLTPGIAFIFGLLFFLTALANGPIASFFEVQTLAVVAIAVTFGAIHGIFTKATKFAFFEPSKEMVFITLDPELKTKGKGVADIAGERLGKSAGAALQWSFLAFTASSSLITIAPALFAAFLFIASLWFYFVFTLSRKLKGDM